MGTPKKKSVKTKSPKQSSFSTPENKTEKSSTWAWGAHHNSPAPSSLSLPSFAKKASQEPVTPSINSAPPSPSASPLRRPKASRQLNFSAISTGSIASAPSYPPSSPPFVSPSPPP